MDKTFRKKEKGQEGEQSFPLEEHSTRQNILLRIIYRRLEYSYRRILQRFVLVFEETAER